MGIKDAVEFATEISLSHLRVVAQLQFDQLAELRNAHAAEVEQKGALAAEKATLTEEIAAMSAENAALRAQLAEMQAQLALKNKALFGRKSERQPRSKPAPKEPKKPQTGHGPREQAELEPPKSRTSCRPTSGNALVATVNCARSAWRPRSRSSSRRPRARSCGSFTGG